MLKLDLPKLEYMPSFVAALREGYYMGGGEQKTEKEIQLIESNFENFLATIAKPEPYYIRADGVKVERVPQIDYWYVDNNEFIGRINIRSYLTPELLNDVGHIGYAVRPSKQNMGHASNMLILMLQYCREHLPLDKVLITCNTNNLSSAKVIEKSGGVLEDIRKRPYDDQMFKRYWITL